ncbi:MAG TPA: GlxA family transcriptional regulator [Solirubrobacteraceae bacterium]|nr:GlxA family transcriptional regulator [Solirubrobacteraceae bacterium]
MDPLVTPQRTRRIVLVAFPDVQSLDVTGPSEVFSLAERAAPGAYAIELVSIDGGPVPASSGLTLLAHSSTAACRGAIDTLVVAGGLGARDAARDERLVSWIRLAARRSRRVSSVCTGAFLLARAGLLDGRRATTHWAAFDALRRNYPSIEVQSDPIFVRDGNVYTSAGVTAGIDLSLALVEEDLGRRAALDVARALVLFVRRPGGQAQFSAGLAGQAADRPSLRDLQDWIADNLDRDLSVTALAARAFMSPRNFARVFAREVGVTPGAYVESVRIERARVLLETTALPLEEVAARCGFGTPETLRRSFARRLRVSPSEYRRRFPGAPVAAPPAGRENVIPIRRAVP